MRRAVYLMLSVAVLAVSCGRKMDIVGVLPGNPEIFPDYSGVTVPENMAPLNFRLETDAADEDAAAIFGKGGDSIVVKGPEFRIRPGDWKRLVTGGGVIEVTVAVKRGGKWLAYAPFRIDVVTAPIDRYVTYRLIDPGYETWNGMGLYQRDLESFDQTPIIRNTETGKNCMNCHSFSDRKRDRMVFHIRGENGGTYIISGGSIEKLDTKTPNTISALVYPQWSPDGRFIAFSVNDIFQAFHSTSRNRVEVYDTASDVVIYDVENYEIFSSPLLFSPDRLETFPSFSPDGRRLFFCSSATPEKMPEGYRDVRYDICAIDFNPEMKSFGETVDTVYRGLSATFPRISPDGKYLMFTEAPYGNFHIWHKEAELKVLDLLTGELVNTDAVNSPDVESYHSWSSNGEWVVFSSRRLDGLYTRLFITHQNEDGTFTKPFLLPQEDSRFYDNSFKSYNIPEFVDGKVAISERQIAGYAVSGTAINVKFKEK